jgi:hypothetical protein
MHHEILSFGTNHARVLFNQYNTDYIKYDLDECGFIGSDRALLRDVKVLFSV